MMIPFYGLEPEPEQGPVDSAWSFIALENLFRFCTNSF